jgi:signal transduction histidine kinase
VTTRDLIVRNGSAAPRSRGTLRRDSRGAWRIALRLTTVLLPAVVVFGAEVIRHELLHGLVPEMLGNVMTGIAALVISALILLPIYRRLEAADARLRATEIEHAVSQERERLARELHDGISQALFFLNVKATALERSLAASNLDPARHTAAEITQAVQDTSRHVRDAIFDLRISPEAGQPLGTWMRTYVRRFGEIHSIAGNVEEKGNAVQLPLESEFHTMAIVREVLHNVAKHAGAQSVEVRIDWDTSFCMMIADDGKGVPESIPGPAQGRFGLTALRDHARAAGGTVAVSRGARGGTVVVFQMPYPGEPARSV